MKPPTLRQLSGLAMIVNTLLPAIVVVTLAAMIWSTAVSIKRNTCTTIGHIAQAVNDEKTLNRYVKAGDDGARRKAISDLVGELDGQTPLSNEECGPWQKLRARIAALLVNEFYGKVAMRVEQEVSKVNTKLENAKSAVANVVPSVPAIKYSGIKIVDKAIWAANQVIKLIRAGFDAIGDALTALGKALAEPFATAKKNLSAEVQKVDYKRAVAWALLERYSSDTVDLFDKFGWFFAVLALWLAFSYALWVHRRFVVGWALLCDRAPA